MCVPSNQKKIGLSMPMHRSSIGVEILIYGLNEFELFE